MIPPDDETLVRIAAVLDRLAWMPDTPHTRELRGKAETYRRQWTAMTVSAAQRLAIRDLVDDLSSKIEPMHRNDDPEETQSRRRASLLAPTAKVASKKGT